MAAQAATALLYDPHAFHLFPNPPAHHRLLFFRLKSVVEIATLAP